MHGKYSRRKILQGLGMTSLACAGFDPITFVMKSVLSGIVNKAHAEEINANDLVNYASIFTFGGGSSWYWDLPLRPNGNDLFQGGVGINPFLGNKLKNKYPNFDLDYISTKVGDYYLPHIWDVNIPTLGGDVKMSSLTQNMLMMRGIHTGIDGHIINPIIQHLPIPGKPSYAGLAADKSITPFPAVSLYSTPSVSEMYSSAKGLSLSTIFNNNMGYGLDYLLAPFKAFPGGAIGKDTSGQSEDLIGALMTRIKEQANKGDPVSQVLYKDRENAIRLLKRSFGDLKAVQNSLSKKYRSLSDSAMRDYKVPGLEDQNIYWDEASRAARSHAFVTTNDGLAIGPGVNINDPFTNDKNVINAKVEHIFACIEYMFTEGITSSIISNTDKLYFTVEKTENLNTKAVKSPHTIYQGFDQHDTGYLLQTVFFHNYYKSLSACLYELRSALESKAMGSGNMFDKTLIHITGDFNREPRTDGKGSDHGFRGSNVTLFSGMIDELLVVGDIKADSGKAQHQGTWGMAAPMSEFGNQVASLKNVASTICTFLKTPSISSNDLSFVRLVNGKVVSNVHRTKNV